MYWQFAIINNRLGEIYFKKTKTGKVTFQGHCYVKREDFTEKKELRALEEDIKKLKMTYRNKKYRVVNR